LSSSCVPCGLRWRANPVGARQPPSSAWVMLRGVYLDQFPRRGLEFRGMTWGCRGVPACGMQARALHCYEHCIALPYPRTGPWPQLPCASAACAMDLETGDSHQRLRQTGDFLRFGVQLSEYYNFGLIEPGRHGCFFGLENGNLEASNHHFFPLCGLGEGCALWGARKSSLTWGEARPKRRFLGTIAEIRNFTVFAPCDAHARWLADP